jgi:hypothetical protein
MTYQIILHGLGFMEAPHIEKFPANRGGHLPIFLPLRITHAIKR